MVDRSRTAQGAYGEMLRSQVAPRLRRLGFTGSGSTFVLPDDDWWLIVGFQGNRYNTAVRVRFTVNLTAARKAAWAADREREPSLPIRPSGNARYPTDTATVIRLGLLMPRREDHWWELAVGRPTEPIALDVVRAIERFALPWLQARIADRPKG